MTETEVESIAKMASISDELLRIIANTRAWVKNYGVMLALTKNPKTPVAVSMNLLSRLNDRTCRCCRPTATSRRCCASRRGRRSCSRSDLESEEVKVTQRYA